MQCIILFKHRMLEMYVRLSKLQVPEAFPKIFPNM